METSSCCRPRHPTSPNLLEMVWRLEGGDKMKPRRVFLNLKMREEEAEGMADQAPGPAAFHSCSSFDWRLMLKVKEWRLGKS